MSVMIVFVAFVLLSEAAAVGIAAIVDQFNKSAGLMVFFALFAAAIWVSWLAAVWVTERYLLGQNGPQKPL